MSIIFPWIYIDLLNNIWILNLNANGDLYYKIMYEEEKWTDERLIDSGVTAYSTYIEDETIHIVYCNIKNELRYCTMKNKKWLGKVLYSIDNNFIVQEIKIKIFESKMHIFYLMKENEGGDHGVLMNCIWNGEDTTLNTIADVILPVNSMEYFKIQLNEINSLFVIFITDEGDGVALKSCNYVNKNWTVAKWLYSVQGEDIDFDVIGNHILNKWKEGNTYFLEGVCIDEKGIKESSRIHESENEIIEPMMFNSDKKLYSSWIENNLIVYSSFTDGKWNKVKKAKIEQSYNIKVYNSYFYSANNLIEGRKIYVTNEPKFEILDYDRLIEKDIDDTNKVDQSRYNDEIIRVNKDNERLEKEIAFINMQLEKKQGIIREYEENNKNILTSKNNSMFLQLQESIQKELDRIKNQLKEEKIISSDLKKQLKENDERNVLLQKQVNILSEENKKLMDDVELERNKTFINRFLRRKSSDQ
ncbi:hypothetical protein [Clostridium akagii]|uniref:hypothetical protein n=1 Tax=Clostridium akagii TaxID=91623 RepID=UPI00047EBD94|nr:hypothetical protein [Clostridium akagii]